MAIYAEERALMKKDGLSTLGQFVAGYATAPKDMLARYGSWWCYTARTVLEEILGMKLKGFQDASFVPPGSVYVQSFHMTLPGMYEEVKSLRSSDQTEIRDLVSAAAEPLVRTYLLSLSKKREAERVKKAKKAVEKAEAALKKAQETLSKIKSKTQGNATPVKS